MKWNELLKKKTADRISLNRHEQFMLLAGLSMSFVLALHDQAIDAAAVIAAIMVGFSLKSLIEDFKG